ncbi:MULTISPECIES: hypothetical protein [unclassified Bradyrhizobium]|uniref:hypothetical protein n=1 Tax=unclassified Bradyrhizobium TaxID=2631580 RepID=UPI0024BFD3A3|nr:MULTISPECIES: hypothetical protein [unclassified Bradyrhizobium]
MRNAPMKTLRRDIACITFSSRFLPLNTSISMSFLFLDSSRHPTSLLQRLRTQPNDHLGGQSLSQIETAFLILSWTLQSSLSPRTAAQVLRGPFLIFGMDGSTIRQALPNFASQLPQKNERFI